VRQQVHHAGEVIEKLAIGGHVERTEHHISKVEPVQAGVEGAQVAEHEAGLDAFAARLFPREIEHCRAQIKPAIGIASSVPFLDKRRRTGAKLENPANLRLGKFTDRCFEEIELRRRIARRQGYFVIIGVSVRLHH